MENYRICPVDESSNDRMLAILESSPINANGLSLCFDKSPDIFRISAMKYHDCMHLGFFSGDDLKGFASLGFYNALIGGKEEKVFSFYHFYILPEARGNRLSELAMKEFIIAAGERATFGIALTLSGNRPVEFYMTGNKKMWMPPVRIIDELIVRSIIFSFSMKNASAYKVRNAEYDDIPEIVRMLNIEHSRRDFGVILDTDTFTERMKDRELEISDYYMAEDRRGMIRGVCLAWDCSSFRKTKVLKVSPKFYPLLWSYKSLEKILPMAPFPSAGECFRELTITDYAVENRDAGIMHSLLCEIYYRHLNRKYHFMNFASCASDNILKAASGFWSNKMVSHIAFTSLDKEKFNMNFNLPYIDIAFL